jgi:hypothetical protein
MAAPEALSTTQVKPTSLANPVPGQDEQDELAGFFEDEVPAAGVQVAEAEAGAGQEAGADEVPADFFADEQAGAAGPLGVEEPVQEKSFLENIPVIGELIRRQDEALARLKGGTAVTADERLEAAAQVFSPKKVRLSDEQEVERLNAAGEWIPLDPEGLDTLDFLDISRDVFETAVETTAKALGVIPAAVAGGIPGIALEGSTSAIFTKTMADLLQSKVAGVPIDPKRDLKLEAALAGSLGATFIIPGAVTSRYLIKGNIARKKEVESLDNIIEIVEDAIAPVKRLQKDGILDPANGGQLLPGQVGREDFPFFQELIEKFKNNPRTRAALKRQKEVGQAAFDAVTGKLRQIVGVAGEGVLASVKFKKALLEGDSVQGKIIGAFRTEASKRLKDQKFPLDNLKQFVGEEASKFTDEAGNISADLVEKTLGTTKEQSNTIKTVLEDFNKLADGATFLQVQGKLKNLKSAFKGVPSEVKNLNKRLRGALADDEVSMIELGLENTGSGEAFQVAKDKLFKLKKIQGNLKTMLKDPLTNRAFIANLFENSKSFGRVEDLKILSETVEPGLFNEMVGEYVNGLITRNTKFLSGFEKGQINWDGVAGQLGKMPAQIRRAIFNEDTVPEQVLSDVIAFNQIVQKSDNFFNASKAPDKVVNFWIATFRAVATQIGKFSAIGSAVRGAKDATGNTLEDFLAEGGIEKVLNTKRAKLLKSTERGALRKFLNTIVSGSARLARTSARVQSIQSDPVQNLLQGTGLEEQGQ